MTLTQKICLVVCILAPLTTPTWAQDSAEVELAILSPQSGDDAQASLLVTGRSNQESPVVVLVSEANGYVELPAQGTANWDVQINLFHFNNGKHLVRARVIDEAGQAHYSNPVVITIDNRFVPIADEEHVRSLKSHKVQSLEF